MVLRSIIVAKNSSAEALLDFFIEGDGNGGILRERRLLYNRKDSGIR